MAGREYGFIDDVQRAFYSGYFKAHGLKAQVATLPNGMIGSILIASLRNSDSGLLNMSNLNDYLSGLLEEAGMRLPQAGNQLPAVYADGMFPQLSCIVARYRNPQLTRWMHHARTTLRYPQKMQYARTTLLYG